MHHASGRHGTLWLPPLPLGHQLGQRGQGCGLIALAQGGLEGIELGPQGFGGAVRLRGRGR